MKTRQILQTTALTLALSAHFINAHAEPISFLFTSTVNYTDGTLSGVNVGTQFSGQFSYESTSLPYSSNGNSAFYSQAGTFSHISAEIAGHKIETDNLSIDIWDNLNGNIQDHFRATGRAPQVDNIQLANGLFNIDLASWYKNDSALNGTSLPTTLDLAAFDAPLWNYGLLLRDTSQSGTILQYTIDSLTKMPIPIEQQPGTVDAPGSLASVLLGLSILALTKGKRRNQV